MLCVNSSSAGGSLNGMARRRQLSSRPHHHLALAAGAHARLSSAPALAGEKETPTLAGAELSKHSQQARKQKRSQEGKFA